MWPRRKKEKELTRPGKYLRHEFVLQSWARQVVHVFDRVKSFHVASTLRQNDVRHESVLEERRR